MKSNPPVERSNTDRAESPQAVRLSETSSNPVGKLFQLQIIRERNQLIKWLEKHDYVFVFNL